ncbi:MAG: dihydroorotase [Pseudomonadota bacterium]
MSALHLRGARLVDPEAETEAEGDLLILDDVIAAVGDVIAPASAEVIDCAGKALAPGIVDLGVYVGEPGARHRESYRTAGLAAAAGGVTTFVAMPSTEPPIDDPAMVEFVRRRAEEICPVNVHVLGALTQGLGGERMSEMGFLRDAGAVGFTDGDRYLADAGVLRRCLAYAAALEALVLHHPQEGALSDGVATEGFFATKSGLPGVPALAERMGLERDLALVELTGARYHAHQLSTAAALGPLERAKGAGLDVTASASIHHLTLNEIDIEPYRTFFKLKPPLRAEEDRQALVQAAAEGLIDVICSGHLPQDEELKRVPFAAAAHGAVGLETLLPAAMQLVHGGAMDLPTLWARLSLAPARRLGLPGGRLAEGAPADLVLFDPGAPFVLDRFRLNSRSKNTPYDGRRMEGRVLATWVGGRQVHGSGAWAG